MKRNYQPCTPEIEALDSEHARILAERAELLALRERIAGTSRRIKDGTAYAHDQAAGVKWRGIAIKRLRDIEAALGKLREEEATNRQAWAAARLEAIKAEKAREQEERAEAGRRRHEKHIRQAQEKAAQRRNRRKKA